MEKKALIVSALLGFINNFLKNDISILRKMGYSVHCAAHDDINNQQGREFFEENGVTIHEIPFSSNKPVSRRTLSAYWEFKKLLKEEEFDAVFVHTPIPGVICRIACSKYRRRGMKVIYETHGLYFHKRSSLKTKLVYGAIEYLMSGLCDAIITINNEDYNTAGRMHCKSVYKIPGVGVDISRFRAAEVNREEYRKGLGIAQDDFLVLAIGELSHRKNHQVVIRALAESGISNAVFAVCGRELSESGVGEELKRLASQLNVRLLLLGFRTDIPELCKCADIGVISSTREGLGLAGIELLAAGTPVVGSDVHGIVDYISDGYNGYLADPGNPEAFAIGIKKLYNNTDRRMISNNCSRSVTAFDISESYRAIETIYGKILSQ